MLPFSQRSRVWEPKARSLRALGGASDGGALDPWRLAPKVGLTVLEADAECLAKLDPASRSHLIGEGGRCWSGGVLPIPLPDGTRLCLLNGAHSRRRNRITLMEEIAHIHLRHAPTQMVMSAGRLSVRDYDHRQEAEAYGVGAAALLPWEAFFRGMNLGRTAEELAEEYEVSTQLVEYRIKITGATRLYNARQRTRARNVTARLAPSQGAPVDN